MPRPQVFRPSVVTSKLPVGDAAHLGEIGDTGGRTLGTGLLCDLGPSPNAIGVAGETELVTADLHDPFTRATKFDGDLRVAVALAVQPDDPFQLCRRERVAALEQLESIAGTVDG